MEFKLLIEWMREQVQNIRKPARPRRRRPRRHSVRNAIHHHRPLGRQARPPWFTEACSARPSGAAVDFTPRASRRPGERGSGDYHFVDMQTFKALRGRRYSNGAGCSNYATSKSGSGQIGKGHDILLRESTGRARSRHARSSPGAVSVFITMGVESSKTGWSTVNRQRIGDCPADAWRAQQITPAPEFDTL